MLELQRMSRAEKLRMMEALWEDLSREEGALMPPVWHEEALKETERLHAAGTENFIDWDTAKKGLRGDQS